MKVLHLHIVDTPEQFAGAEKTFLATVKGLAEDQTIEVAAALNEGTLFDQVSLGKFKIFLLPDKGISRIPSFYSNVLHIIRAFKPEIIHSHHRYTTFLAQLIPFRSYKLIHTFRVEQFTKRWNRFFGDYATAVSEGCKQHFVKYFNLRDEFITVIYNGIDAPVEDCAALHYERNNGDVIASVIARLTEQKGHPVLIEALSLLPEPFRKNLKVILVGDGEKRGELESMTKEFGLNGSIVFAGYQKDVYPYVMLSDFTILPSLWEGFGRAIIESFLCGKPVIGSNVGGIPELIRDHENGLLVPPNDPKALSEAILYFGKNPDLVKRYGEKGKRFALDGFTREKMISDYKRYYRAVLDGFHER